MYIANFDILSTTTFSDNGSTFTNGMAATGGVVYCTYCSNITLTGGTFTNNYANEGGAFYIDFSGMGATGTTTISATSTTFINNAALGDGGVFYISQGSDKTMYLYPTITLTSLTATNNIAGLSIASGSALSNLMLGQGGVVWLDVESFSLTVSGGTYKANSGDYGGCFYLKSTYNTDYTSQVTLQNSAKFTQT